MKIVVIGGAGFIGYHTCEALLAQGCNVLVIDDFSTGSRKNKFDLEQTYGSRIEFFEFDITKASTSEGMELLIATLFNADAVMMLAAKVSVQDSVQHTNETTNVNVAGFVNCLHASAKAGVKKFVFASSAAVYGDHGDESLVEDSDLTPISPYGIDKVTNELYGYHYSKFYDMTVVGLRYFNVYGPRQDPSSPYSGVIGKFVNGALTDQTLRVFGDGQQSRNFVYVTDVAKVNAGILTAYELKINSTLDEQNKKFIAINVAFYGPVTNLIKLLKEIGTSLDKSLSIKFESSVPGDIKNSKPSLSGMRNFLSNNDIEIPSVNLSVGISNLIKYLSNQNG